jgi:hypothetical protein
MYWQTGFPNKFCQQVLPTGFADRFCQQVLPTGLPSELNKMFSDSHVLANTTDFL